MKPKKQSRAIHKKKKTTTKKSKASPKYSYFSIPKVPEIGFQSQFWKKNWIYGLILFVSSFVLYGISIPYEYVLDDKIVIVDNNYTKKGVSGIWDILSTESFTGYLGKQKDLVAGGRYRPLSIVVFAIEWELFSKETNDKNGNKTYIGNKEVSHIINIFLYGLVVLLLFRVLAILFANRPSINDKWYYYLPFIAALLYALHPIHSEVVANIKGRDEIMAILFALSAIYFTLKYVTKNSILPLILSAVCFFLSLMSKESTLPLLAVIPLMLYVFTNKKRSTLLYASLPYLVSAIAYLVIRTSVLGYFLDSGVEVTNLMNNSFAGATFQEKWGTIFYTLGKYVLLLFFPHPLTHDYYAYQIPLKELSLTDYRALLSILLYVSIGVFAVINVIKKSVPAFAILFYLITLSIVSNIAFNIGTFMNERFMFLPSIGFILLISYWLTHFIPKFFPKNISLGRNISITVLAIFCLGFIIKTYERVPAWKNPLTLNRAGSSVSTNSARANCFMGVALYNEALSNKGKDQEKELALYKEADYYINRSLSIHPTYKDPMTMRAGIDAGYYKFDKDLDKLLKGFTRVCSARRISYVDQYMNYLNKKDVDKTKLINFYHNVAMNHFAKRRDFQSGIDYTNMGLQAVPGSSLMYQDLCYLYYDAGNMAKVVENGELAISQTKNIAELYLYTGKALIQTSNADRGQQYLNKAYQMKPSLKK